MITSIGLSVLTCAIYSPYCLVPKSYIYTKTDQIGNKPFWLYGLSMGIKISDNGCGC